MKILYYFKEQNTPMYQWQRHHIFEELKSHSCDIKVFNPLLFKTIEEANYELINHLKNESYDLFMTPHGSEDLYIDVLLKIKERSIPTLLICFDSLMTPLKHKDIARHFDLVLLSQEDTNQKFKSFNCNYIISPYAANPKLFMPNYDENINRIGFIGTPYGSRVNKINHLLSHNIPVDLYANLSNQTQHMNEIDKITKIKNTLDLLKFEVGRKVIYGAVKQKISNEKFLDTHSNLLNVKSAVNLKEMSYLFSNYDLSLSISEARNTGVLKKPVNIVHLRNFEIPMSGGLQICSYFDELANYFEEDKEILYYRSKDEFVEKVNFYLKPEQENLRFKMKLAARRRAEHDHTWFIRFKKVFDYFNLTYT